MTELLPNWGTWKCYKGDGFSRAFVLKSNGVAINIAGYTITFTAKTHATDTDARAVISKALTITSAANGTFQLDLAATDTNITPADLAADIEIQPPSGGPTSILGTFSVVQDVRHNDGTGTGSGSGTGAGP